MAVSIKTRIKGLMEKTGFRVVRVSTLDTMQTAICRLEAERNRLLYAPQYEYVNCPCCGSNLFSTVYEVHEIVKCAICNLVFSRKRISQKKISAYYQSDYISGAIKANYETVATPRAYDESSAFWRSVIAESNEFAHSRIELYKKWSALPADGERFRFIEIGGGWGKNLIGFKNLGEKYDACMYELGKANVEFAKNLGLAAYSEDFLTVDIPAESVDYFYMHHVFEHLPAPMAWLIKLHTSLKRSGLLEISVPNFDSKWHEVAKEKWAWHQPLEHLTHFTAASITKLLAMAGYQVLEVRYDTFCQDIQLMEGNYRGLSEEQIDTLVNGDTGGEKGEHLRVLAKKP